MKGIQRFLTLVPAVLSIPAVFVSRDLGISLMVIAAVNFALSRTDLELSVF